MTTQTLYINTIDECVNNIIDSFYLEILENLILTKKIYTINYIFDNFEQLLSSINILIDNNTKKYKINEIITNKDAYIKIINLFNDYILLYYFFYLGKITDLDNIIDQLNKLNNKHQINFFKNQYLTQYSIYYKYIIDYHIVLENISLLGLDKFSNTIPDQKFINNYIDIIKSIEGIETEILIEIASNKDILTHNILKLIIFREIYMKEDKLMIFKILENEELSIAEYKYIEIIDTKYDIIDYAIIESLFNINEIKQGLAEEVFQMINNYEMVKLTQDFSIDIKINHLFKKKILIPITDEFLRYHKDSEIYDHIMTTNNSERVNKKDNTKIKYIVNKVNKVKDFYNPKYLANQTLSNDIEKIFYQPLMYRKVIIINDLEEINILHKLSQQDKTVINTNEYYEELKQIRLYPYIEFKFTNKDSFNFRSDTTIETLRYCNFEYKNDPKFQNISKTDLQYRIINNNIKANIVGVAIPRFNLINTNLNNRYNQTIIACHKLSDTMDMSLLHKNSFMVAIKKLRKLFLEDKHYSKLLYWIFNTKNDQIKLDLFDNIKQLPKDDYIKLLLGKVYDTMVDITYKLILNQINSLDKIDIKTANLILRNLESKLVIIPRWSDYYAEIIKLIYYIKAESNISTYDTNEDKILDINTQLIKLPKVILEKITLHVITISKYEQLINIVDDIDMYEGYLCQHIISWNNLMKFKRNNPNKFNQELYNFIKKYIIENNVNDFICKSCYQLVDLRKYTTEIYPGSESIVISYGLETELETISDYVKYTKAIKNMEKIIEKITYSANLLYFIGSGLQIKLRRQEIIKNIIDIIEIQYKILFTKESNIRKEQSIKKYGCSKTNLYLFKFDNDIFTFSSKETDKYKLFKMNNLLIYILLCILIEINLSQILYLAFDKLVNYYLFITFGFNTLFDNLYIRISNKNDIAPIKNYKLLCYIIYYLSGTYAKFNMWYTEDIPYKPNTINPNIQRFIIHTFVDILNSILEINSKENAHYLYNIIATKFFNKLNSVYSNSISIDVISKLELINKKKVSIINNKKIIYNTSSVNAMLLQPYIYDGKYIIESILGTKQIIASYPNTKFIFDKLYDKTIDDLIGKTKLKEINENLYMDSLINIAIIYDIDGNKRNEPISKDIAAKLELNKLKQISEAAKNIRINNQIKIINKIEKKLERINIKNIQNNQYLEKLRLKFNSEISEIIFNFVTKLESLIGKNININNNNYYLLTNVFEINHDYLGNKKSSIFLLESDNKIKYKKNDQYFNQDIYYYDDLSNQVTIYYSGIERFIIGYKELSKDYVKILNTDCYLKIHYSFQNQLKLLGFNYINYKIDSKINNINDFINNILRIRLQNLKNSLSNIQQIIYQIKNNFKGSNLNSIAKYYQTKIKSINTYNIDGIKIFKDWNLLNNNLFYSDIDINSDINIIQTPNKNKYLSSEKLLKYISNNDIILYYIIEEFNMLLDINLDNYTKVNLAYMIINIIFQIYRNITNFENAIYDINVKKFYHWIIYKIDTTDIQDDIDNNINLLSIDDIEKIKEEQDIDKESMEALDMEQDIESSDDFGDEDIKTGDRD